MTTITTVSLNLVVLRSVNPERLAAFYSVLGLEFEKHQHGKGPWHFASELANGGVLEIYPQRSADDFTSAMRLGFGVESVDKAVEQLRKHGAMVISGPKDSPWGRRAILRDIEGHTIELIMQ